MLVLTRKTDEQILIGDDIKITLIRVRGNSVRIGIDAPRDVRVVRGELEAFDSKSSEGADAGLSDREQVFAHPQPKVAASRPKPATNRLSLDENNQSDPIRQATAPHTFAGRVRVASDEPKLVRAPLRGFVSAS